MLNAFELGLISASLVQRRMYSTTGLVAMGMGLRHRPEEGREEGKKERPLDCCHGENANRKSETKI